MIVNLPLGQVMVGISGLTITPEARELLQHPQTGGVILFRRNFKDIEQLQALVADIKAIRSPELLIAVDHEGGRVQRFTDGFTLIPPMRQIGNYYEQDQAGALKLAYSCGWLMASELLAVNIDISFAPVLDVDTGKSSVIGDRSFHSNPKRVSLLAENFIRGMQAAGMVAVGKHFPGHGSVKADSHHELPIDERSFQEIAEHDLIPFTDLIAKNCLAGIMPAHIHYTQIDNQAAGFSKHWLQNILRQQLGFKGIIFSDDLGMAGASQAGSYPERAQLALAAGCDVLLSCNDAAGTQEILNSLDGQQVNETISQRLELLRGKPKFTWEQLKQSSDWQANREVLKLLNKNEIQNLPTGEVLSL